jgi:hypothetical protein
MGFRVAQGEGLSIGDATFAAKLNKDVIVRISGNRTINVAAAGHTPFGRVSVPARAANELGTVETFFRERYDLETTTNIAAGDFFKLAAVDVTGNNRVAKWVAGTDTEELKCGICWNGGSTGAIVEVFFR